MLEALRYNAERLKVNIKTIYSVRSITLQYLILDVQVPCLKQDINEKVINGTKNLFCKNNFVLIHMFNVHKYWHLKMKTKHQNYKGQSIQE